MSKIKAELIKATELSTKRGESDADQKVRLLHAVSELDDDGWNGLSAEAQTWFNDSTDAVNGKKPPLAFPDEPKEDVKEDKKPARRGAAKEEEAETPEPAVDDEVTIVTKRGKTANGKVVEISDDLIVILDGKEEVEYPRDRIESITVKVEEKPARSSRKKAEDDEPEKKEEPAVAEPNVGDVVEAVTGRGKTVAGEVVEVGDDLVVVKEGKDEVELTVSKLKSLKVTKPAKAVSGRRGAAKEEPKGDEKEKHTKTSKAENGGVSATTRMREILVDDMSLSEEGLIKQLKKEGLTFRDATAGIIHTEIHRAYKLFDAAGMIKKGK